MYGKPTDNRMQLDTSMYVSNLLRKITLLEDQIKFEKGEKLKQNIRVRELERAFEEINFRQANQSYEDDSELL